MKVLFIVIGEESHFRDLIDQRFNDIVWHVVSKKDESIPKDVYYRRANAAARYASTHYLVWIICNDHPLLTAMVISKVHMVRKSYQLLEVLNERQFRALKIP